MSEQSTEELERKRMEEAFKNYVASHPLPADHELDDAECHNCGEPWDEDNWSVRHIHGGPSPAETWMYECPGCERETFQVGI